jgi:hypothetical protein
MGIIVISNYFGVDHGPAWPPLAPLLAVSIWYQVLPPSLIISFHFFSFFRCKFDSILEYYKVMFNNFGTCNLQRYYLPSARELSRLIGICRAPIIQHFEETISVTSTIKSFDQQSRFHETNMKLKLVVHILRTKNTQIIFVDSIESFNSLKPLSAYT